MAWRFRNSGIPQMYRSLFKKAFVRELRKFIPALSAQDLVPAPAGVRAQTVFPNGALAQDFEIIQQDGLVHVLNAPSPAATASLEIADYIVSLVEK